MKQKLFIATSLCLVTLAGCGDGLDRFPVAPTQGQIMCKGKPVPNAMVFFEPMRSEGGSANVGKPGFAEADQDGKFVLTTYSEGDGAVFGRHNVKVTAPSGEDYPAFKCDCKLSELDAAMQVEVVDGDNNFTIDLPDAPRRKKKEELSEDELEELEDK